MEIVGGPTATQTLLAFLQAHQGIAVLDVDPAARQGTVPTTLCVANADHSLLLDATDPGLAAAIVGQEIWAAYDAKNVHRALFRAWGRGPNRWACLVLCEQLIEGGRSYEHSIDALAKRYATGIEDANTGLEAWSRHCQQLAAVLQKQIAVIKRDELSWVSKIEAAAVAPIAEMEHRGIGFNTEKWLELDRQAKEEKKKLADDLIQILDVPQTQLFSGSVESLENDGQLKLLLNKAGHVVTDLRRRTVAQLPAPLGPTLARFRELAKVISTYGEPFLHHVARDGRIHPTFVQIGASTGRMACHAPNLQSILSDGPHRSCFCAPQERMLITADYSACELRILAEMSGDPVFAEAFARNEDLHSSVATRIFGKPVSKTQNVELRERAKIINFGLAYGMGAGGLAQTAGTSMAQARELLDRYFKTFPKIHGFLQHAAADALKRGYAKTLTGRRLYLPPPADSNARSQAERIAKNMPIQGTNADIIKIALARLRQRLTTFRESFVVNTVHDEIVVECPKADAEAVGEAVVAEMIAAGKEVLRHTPVAVDVAIAPSWH